MFLFDGVWSTDFLAALFILSGSVWIVLKYLFGATSFLNALVLGFLAMMFLPWIVGASQTLFAFMLLVGLGAWVIQSLYKGASFTAGILAMLVVLAVGAMVLPSIY